MRNIAELTMLQRGQTQMPSAFRPSTDTFQEGWNFVASENARGLERKIKTQGWHLIKIDAALRGSGVGETAQAAKVCALKLALRRVSDHFNVVKVQQVWVTEYPWFFVARVNLCRYRIQMDEFLPIAVEAAQLAARALRRPFAFGSIEMGPQLAGTMPLLRQMLAAPHIRENRLQ